jgi:hypothetical protein
MKVLAAKRPASPRREVDVWSAMHGETIVAPFVCQDRGCDCDHVHQGIVSHGYSTEAADLIEDMRVVAERYPTETVLRMTFDHQVSRWRYTAI